MSRLPIHHISQFEQEIQKYYKNRGCGFASILMILRFYGINNNITSIQNNTSSSEAWNPNTGLWQHHGLIKLSNYYNLHGYRINYAYNFNLSNIFFYIYKIFTETKSISSIHALFQSINYTKKYNAIYDIKRLIDENKPVITSMFPTYLKHISDTHLVVVSGYDESGIYIHDPHTYGQYHHLTYSEFEKHWTKRAIVVIK